MGHAQRLQDVAPDVGLVRLARDPLDDVAGQGGAVVRIGGRGAGLVHPLGNPRLHRHSQRPEALRIGADQALDGLFEPGGVSHQPAKRDRAVRPLRNPEVEVGVDVLVEVELALADELHHGRPGEQLADRARPENGVRLDRRLGGEVRIAIALHQDRLAVLHHGHDRTRDVAPAQGVGHEAIEPGFDVGLVQDMAGAGLGRGGSGGDRRRLQRRAQRLSDGGRRQERHEQRQPATMMAHRTPPRKSNDRRRRTAGLPFRMFRPDRKMSTYSGQICDRTGLQEGNPASTGPALQIG